jgi:hypothetical protein
VEKVGVSCIVQKSDGKRRKQSSVSSNAFQSRCKKETTARDVATCRYASTCSLCYPILDIFSKVLFIKSNNPQIFPNAISDALTGNYAYFQSTDDDISMKAL